MDGNNPKEEDNWLIRFFQRRLEMPAEDRKYIVNRWNKFKFFGSLAAGWFTGMVFIEK